MFNRSKYLQLGKGKGNKPVFGGGLITALESYELTDGDSPEILNARIKGKDTVIRPGFVQLGENFGGLGDYARGIGGYINKDATEEYLLVAYKQSGTEYLVKVEEDGTQTPITTGTNITTEARTDFTVVGGTAYICNGVDYIGKYDGTSYSTFFARPYVANNMTFDAGAKTITTTGADFDTRGFISGLIITIEGTASNNGTYTIESVSGKVITLISTDVIVNETVFTIMYENFTPAFTVLFDGSIWASGYKEQSDSVYKSVKGNGENFTGSGSDVFSNFGDNITGLGVTMQSLFYFTSTSIWVTDKDDIDSSSGVAVYNQRPLVVREGSVNHAGIVIAGNFLFFVTPSNKIKYITRGNQQFDIEDLSHKEYAGIEEYMKQLDEDQTDCFGYYLPFENLIKWHFKSKGSSYNNICIIYDLTHKCFLTDTQKFFYAGISFKNKYYTIGMLEDKIYRDEYSFTDDGSPIGFKKVSKDFITNGPTFKQELYQARRMLTLNRLAILTEKIYIDGNLIHTETFDGTIIINDDGIGTYPIGTSQIGIDGDNTGSEQEFFISIGQQVTEKSMLSVRGYKIRVVWECYTLGARVTLKDYDLRTEGLNELIS